MAESDRRAKSRHDGSIAAAVERRILDGGERFWRLEDFADLPAGAVARALSRLASAGTLERVQKGLYWRPRQTVIGPSIPAASAALARSARAPMHPAGLTAANVLGMTTQNPMRPEFATPAAAAPHGASGALVHTRRPHVRATVDATEGALLEFLRDRGRSSDLDASSTIDRVAHLLRETGRYSRLVTAAMEEPPRVRAMLGAFGELIGAPSGSVRRLRESLNPISRFDFGKFADMPNARDWQAR